MKIVHFHKVATPLHSGYRADPLCNPSLREVDTVLQADYVWYNAWGDTPNICNDLAAADEFEIPVAALITGDKCYTPPAMKSGNLFFVTNAAPKSETTQFEVPYSYHPSLEWFGKIGQAQHEILFNRKRRHLAGFQGSFNTNHDRNVLKQFEKEDILIVDCDGWQASRGEFAKRAVDQHHLLLLDSDFAFCPRGIGKSSIRVVEAIFRGAVPVMIDDQTRLFGDDMEFAIRWPARRSMADLESQLREMRDTGALEEKQRAMRKWLHARLLVDFHAGIHNVVGFTEWIRSKL